MKRDMSKADTRLADLQKLEQWLNNARAIDRLSLKKAAGRLGLHPDNSLRRRRGSCRDARRVVVNGIAEAKVIERLVG
jgi:hypothetical protein